uniref:AB hydrolase-1 domain-containing protein n=1 Tax=Anopheles atroparvus TaxID=41427 RepID=A0AAG5CXN6_ANOAO
MAGQKQNYDVLEVLPKWEIAKIYLRCLLANFVILLKWLYESVKCKVNPTAIMRRTIERTDFPNKPPIFMTDTNLGRHSYVKLENTKLHFVEAGNRSNPIVVLLHGFPDCWFGWRYQISELTHYFHVIALDLKGFNDSDKPHWRFEYTPKKVCEDLRKFLIAISAKSVSIIGHDLGGTIGWYFAHTNPEMVDKFVSVSTPHPNLLWDNVPKSSPFNRSWLEFVQLPMLPEMELKHTADKVLRRCYPHVAKEKLYLSGTNGSMSNNLMEAYQYSFCQTDDWRGPLNYFRNFLFYRIREGEIIQCPCLIIAGNDDRFYKLETVVKSSEFCENFMIKIIEQSGRAPHQEMATEFNSTLLKFLIGKKYSQKPSEMQPTSSRGLVGRMFGGIGTVANNTVKLGNNLRETYAFANPINNREKIKLGHAAKANIMGKKLAWFAEKLEGREQPLEPSEFAELIDLYLQRFDEELEQIKIVQSIGKHRANQHASREAVIRSTLGNEKLNFNGGGGLELPDLCDPVQFKQFQEWDGNAASIQHLKLKFISRKLLQSSKPVEKDAKMVE